MHVARFIKKQRPFSTVVVPLPQVKLSTEWPRTCDTRNRSLTRVTMYRIAEQVPALRIEPQQGNTCVVCPRTA